MLEQAKMLLKRVMISGDLEFDTAFHIGSGREGLLSTDMGVLLDANDRPILPGSSLKGNFRSTAERLAPHLGLSACLLNSGLSGVNCITDETYRNTRHQEFKDLKEETKKITWLTRETCAVCKLFGSPYQGSRIFFSDGSLKQHDLTGVQLRDGVCIDRDSGTAVNQMVYNFEVVAREVGFSTTIELENPSDAELALVGAVLAEWQAGFRIGGFTSRGLGKVRLTDVNVRQVDYTNPEQLKAYLVHRRMTEAPRLFEDSLDRHLTAKGA